MYEFISTAEGLSQGLINDMLQDREGFIWIATKGGLNRYDGYNFKIFTTDPQDTSSISSNVVSNLLEDSKGRLWVGTYDGGLNVYNKKTGRFFRINQKPGEKAGLSGNRIVSAMVELPDGRILVCPQAGSLDFISLAANSGSLPIITHLKAPGNREVLGLGVDDKGLIWVGCTDGSIFIFTPSSETFDLLTDGTTFTALVEKMGNQVSARVGQLFFLYPNPDILVPFQDSTGQLHDGIISTSKEGNTVIDKKFPLKMRAAGSVYYDFSNLKKGEGINKARAYILKTSVTNQTIKCILMDRSGVLWVGMLGHGLYKYRVGGNRFTPILPKLSIQKLKVLNKDIIYVHGWRTIKTVTSLGVECANPLEKVVGNAPPVNVLQAQSGDYWVYSMEQKQLSRFSTDLKLQSTYAEPVNPTTTEQLQPMVEDSRHRIWVCGANGTLARVDPVTGQIAKFVIENDHGSGTAALAQTTGFYEDGSGVFWMGTENGFARLVFGNNELVPTIKWFKNIPGNSNSLSYNYVSWFMDDAVNPDYLWISTKGGGLNRMQKSTGNFIHYTTRQGLPNDVVYGTLTDNAGNLWGSTNRGIFCMLTGSGKNTNENIIRIFSTSDGLQADEFNTNALGKLDNGDLVFGGVNGMNIFNPEKVLAASYTPNVFITGFLIANKMITPGDETGVLNQTIEQTKSITLNYLQDVFTLEFSSLDFTAPGQNKYRYQLVGIDKDWVESGSRRTATYLHLPSGDYIFKVQGSNSQGVWSAKIAELKIIVLPPWWRSWWAYVIYMLVIALVTRAYLIFSINRAKLKAQLIYEQREAKRVKELDTVKTQLYTNITHEFRTPLTVILGMAQKVLKKPDENFNTSMNMIIRNGESLLNLVNEMLDLSKLESGTISLHLVKGDVINFLRYVSESFHSLVEGQKKGLHFLTDIDCLNVVYDSEKLRQVFVNLLSNAIKFTPEKGNVYINITKEVVENHQEKINLVVKVKDTGTGIPEDQLSHIFDRFYQLDNSLTRMTTGTGIGLSITKELVNIMGGEIIVKSPPAGACKGSEFTVILPMTLASDQDATYTPPINVPLIAIADDAELLGGSKEGIQQNADKQLILLVEDNADVVAYTASCLADYRLAVGRNGQEGFEIAIERIPDLIITDVMMPLVDGFELVGRLRKDERTSHIPIIMLTAKANIESRLQGLEQGVDVYLDKPFHEEELVLRISKLLQQRKELQQYYLKKAGLGNNAPATLPDLEPEKVGVKIENAFVTKVRKAIEQNLSDANFSVDQLCKLVFLSHSQLHRKLEALTGSSPSKFIRIIRLNKAKELLKDPENSIASVAIDCGYNDPGYFARVFKQEFGMAPQEWRSAIIN